jgi:hypothetical protein
MDINNLEVFVLNNKIYVYIYLKQSYIFYIIPY